MEPVNLKHLSTIAVAARIWENPTIKKQIRDYHLSEDRPFTVHRVDAEFLSTITKLALLLLDSLELPLELKNHCENVIREMGEKILYWVRYVIQILEFDLKFAEQIYWLPDVTIDECKIFKTWENDQDFLNQENLIMPASYILACINFQEDFFISNQVEVEELLQKISNPRKSANQNLPDIPNIGIYTLIAECLQIFIDKHATGSRDSSWDIFLPKNMFSLCLAAGLFKPAFYFWDNYLSGNNEIDLTDLVFNTFRMRNPHTIFRRDKENKGFFFLISKMTEEERKNLFEENAGGLYTEFVHEDPSHKINVELLNNHFSSLGLDNNLKTIFGSILDDIKYYKSAGWNSKVKEYRLLFQHIFTRFCEEI